MTPDSTSDLLARLRAKVEEETPPVDLLLITLRTMSKQLDGLQETKRGGGGNEKWVDRAWDLLRWLIVPWIVWVSVSLIQIKETRFTNKEGSDLFSEMKALRGRVDRNEHDIDDTESTLEEHVRDHNGSR